MINNLLFFNNSGILFLDHTSYIYAWGCLYGVLGTNDRRAYTVGVDAEVCVAAMTGSCGRGVMAGRGWGG